MSKKILYINGHFHTLDPATEGCEALAAEDGLIIEAGTKAALRPLTRRGFETIDLKKKCVIPGIIDSHLHFLYLGYSFKRANLDGVDSLSKVESILRKAARKLSPGEWLRGRGWNKNLWGGEFPDKGLLDKVTSNPVALSSKDGHLLWVNSAALEFCGINRNTPDPPGGVIAKDESGEPTGILKENACDYMFEKIPSPSRDTKVKAVKAAQKHLISLGITGVGDCDGDTDLFGIYHELDRKGRLSLRVFKMISKDNLQRAIDFKFHTGEGSEHLRVGCVKLFADGALGSQTAFMFEPYTGSTDNFGVETLTTSEIEHLAGQAAEAGIGAAIHAIGDRANYQALCGIGKHAELARRKGLRSRIEHAQVLRKADIALFKAYGIIAAVQPIHATSDRDVADKYWGKRSRYAYPFKTLLAKGARLSFGSDAPIEDANPLAGIHAATTRKRAGEDRPAWYPEEIIGVEQAVEAYTKGAAFACRFDDIAGSLSIGKRADFVVLSKDIFEISPDKIADVEVLKTVIDGKIVFDAAG